MAEYKAVLDVMHSIPSMCFLKLKNYNLMSRLNLYALSVKLESETQ